MLLLLFRVVFTTGTSVSLTFPKGATAFDRVIIKEELRFGQLVTSFDLLGDDTVLFSGTSIGRTLIVQLGKNVTASKLEVRFAAFAAHDSLCMELEACLRICCTWVGLGCVKRHILHILKM